MNYSAKYVQLLGRLFDAAERMHPLKAAALGIRFGLWWQFNMPRYWQRYAS